MAMRRIELYLKRMTFRDSKGNWTNDYHYEYLKLVTYYFDVPLSDQMIRVGKYINDHRFNWYHDYGFAYHVPITDMKYVAKVYSGVRKPKCDTYDITVDTKKIYWSKDGGHISSSSIWKR